MRRRLQDPVFRLRQKTLAKARYRANPQAWQKYRLKTKEYLKNHPKKVKKYSKRKVEWERERYKRDPVFKLMKIHRIRIRQFMKGVAKTLPSECLLGCSAGELKIHLESQFKPGMTWENHGEYIGDGTTTWNIDHVKPLSQFDLTDVEQQKIAFHYTNLQPMWAKDNLKKGDKYNAASVQ
jgi:hypothetical protein